MAVCNCDNVVLTAGGDIRPTADSTTAINIGNAAATNFVTFDTTNQRVGIGTTSPQSQLDVSAGPVRVAGLVVVNASGQVLYS